MTIKTNSNNNMNNINNINSLTSNAMKNTNNTFRTTTDQTDALIQSLAAESVKGNAAATNKLITMVRPHVLSFLTAKFKGNVAMAEDMTQDLLLVNVWGALSNGTYSPEKGKFKSWVMTVAYNRFRDYTRRKKSGPQFVSMDMVEYKASNQDFLDRSYEADTDDCCNSEDYYDAMKAPQFASDDYPTSEDFYDATAAASLAEEQDAADSDTPEDATDAGNPAYCLNADPLTLMIAAEDASERKAKLDMLKKAVSELPEDQQIVVKACYLGDTQFNEIAEECGKPLATVLSYGRRGRKALEKKMTVKGDNNRA